MRKSTMFILTVVLILLNTFAYSALATNLSITGEAVMRAVSDIRVTNIAFDSAENDATLYYESKYTKDTITNGFILPNANSSISYNVTIKNNGTIDQAIYDLQTVSSSNNDMIILIDNKPINEALPMIVPFGTSKTIKITYKTNSPSSNVINIINKFIFKEVYYVEYNTKGGSSVETQIKYKDVDLTLEGKPTKNKYVFTGWTDEQNGQAVKYNEGSTYTLNEDKTLYAIWRTGEATFITGEEFNVKIKQLAGNTNVTSETEDTNITSIVRANSLPNNFNPTDANIVSTTTSDFPIYAWYDNGIIYWYSDVDNPYMNASSYNMFRSLTKVTNIDINTINTSRIQSMHAMFMGCNSLTSLDLSNFDTSNVTDMSYMFFNCRLLSNINLSSFNTSNVQNMSYMFSNCYGINNINLNNFNTSNVTTMTRMFYYCNSLTTLNLSSFNTSNVTSMYGMFQYCNSLESITFGNNFDTSRITSMNAMFYDCSSLITLDLSSFDTSSLIDMANMFDYVNSLTSLDISSFNMSSVTSVTNMLLRMTSLRQLKTPKVYPSNLSITLPNTFYDPSNNAYTTLATGNPTKTWIKLPYTVKYNSNNGTGTMADQKIGVDATTTLTTNAFTREGYTFAGWNTKADGTGTAYLNNAQVTNLKTYNEEITLYAQWIGNTYIVTFDYNDGVTSSTTKNVTFGGTYGTLPTPTREGYEFDGWNGKNLFYPYNSEYSIMGIDTVRNSDESFSISGTPNTVWTNLTPESSKHILSPGEYTMFSSEIKNYSICIKGKNVSGGSYYEFCISPGSRSRSFTIEDNWQYYLFLNSLTPNQYIEDTLYFQIQKDDTNVSGWEPYHIQNTTTVVQPQNHTLTALWEKKEATFDTGANFNKKIKQLANPTETVSDYSFNDTNITSIQRANSLPSSWIVNDEITPPSNNNIISTSTSPYPIYAWYDSGTIYYYSEALNPYMNISAGHMFRGLTNVINIDITSVDTSKVQSPLYMFLDTPRLSTIDLSNFDTSGITDFSGMFERTGFTSLDLSSFNINNATLMAYMFSANYNLQNITFGNNFDTSNIKNMKNMFASCISLTSLDLSNFDMSNVSNTTNTLSNMTALKSLKTPNTIPSGVTVDLPKMMIDSSGNEYTQLTSTTPTSTWLYIPTKFDEGADFNKKIKKLSGDTNPTYATTNSTITSIQRTNSVPSSWIVDNEITPPSDNNIVSSIDSYKPIYAWYDNGIIYWYSESTYVYLNKYTNYMFSNLFNVTTIDFSTIKTNITTNMGQLFYGDHHLTTNSLNLNNWDTSNVVNMENMFQSCWAIQNLDLSSFNTSKVTSMRAMFYAMDSLESVNLSSFDTSIVQSMYYMFNSTKINNLDLSNFNMSRVTNTTDMFGSVSTLTSLKTPSVYPSDTSLTITLPTTLYDVNGTSYTTLTSISPINTWLKTEYVPYTITYDLDGGSVSTPNPTTYTKGSSSITLNNPTKSGYTFKGWSGGKNLFDEESILMAITNATYENGYYNFRNIDAYQIYGNNNSFPISNFKANTQYTLSLTGYTDSSNMSIWAYYTNGDYERIGNVNSEEQNLVCVTSASKTLEYIRVSFGSAAMTHIKNVQLEEGSSATSYEPYISEQTTITIPTGTEGNRTYTAIWEEDVTPNNNLNNIQASVNNILNGKDILKLFVASIITSLIPIGIKFH